MEWEWVKKKQLISVHVPHSICAESIGRETEGRLDEGNSTAPSSHTLWYVTTCVRLIREQVRVRHFMAGWINGWCDTATIYDIACEPSLLGGARESTGRSRGRWNEPTLWCSAFKGRRNRKQGHKNLKHVITQHECLSVSGWLLFIPIRYTDQIKQIYLKMTTLEDAGIPDWICELNLSIDLILELSVEGFNSCFFFLCSLIRELDHPCQII